MTRLEGIARQLEADAARLRDELAQLDRDRQETDWSTRPVETGDLADQAADRDRRERSRLRHVELSRRLDQVEAALLRIADGSYGICEVCDGPISPDRLEVLPHTTVCTAHGASAAAPREARARRPATVDLRTAQVRH